MQGEIHRNITVELRTKGVWQGLWTNRRETIQFKNIRNKGELTDIWKILEHRAKYYKDSF